MSDLTLLIIQSNKPISDLTTNIAHAYKLKLLDTFYKHKFENPKQTQKEICTKMGISPSTFGRHVNDIEGKSPSKYLRRKKETVGQGLQCSFCEKICKNKHGLNTHTTRKHKGESIEQSREQKEEIEEQSKTVKTTKKRREPLKRENIGCGPTTEKEEKPYNAERDFNVMDFIAKD